ncbi:hypothetical protein [Acetobacter pasteurianus]|uniref:hypothetical protein n=1 Tax=Acetobacter pasteurianus TaxID=438 RepID=UPI001F527090|nr:hypothetical protein [Acetobacter pasteurianus]
MSVPAHALTTPNSPPTDGANDELANTLRLAVTTLQRELDRRAEEAAQDKEDLSRLRDSNADLKARLAVAEARLTEREHPTDGVSVQGEQKPDVQVNDQGERPPRTWWQRLFSVYPKLKNPMRHRA